MGLRGAGAAGDVEQTAAETDAADLESPAEYSSGRPTGPRPLISSCAVLASSSRLSVPPMRRCRHARPFASATTQVWVVAEWCVRPSPAAAAATQVRVAELGPRFWWRRWRRAAGFDLIWSSYFIQSLASKMWFDSAIWCMESQMWFHDYYLASLWMPVCEMREEKEDVSQITHPTG
jgi:hypothetical protein